MLPTLPTTTPAEVLNISPEALEIANCYLQSQSLIKVSEELGISPETVSMYLERREVKAYIDNVFHDVGFNNRFKMRSAMDALIAKKFRDMDEADIGSSKDITTLLELSHRFTMDYMNAQIQLEKLRASSPRNQTNIQINDSGSNYGSLIDKLINGKL